MAYLRGVWDRNAERREPVAMGLAQSPGGENWQYLVRSLPILEDMTARETLQALRTVEQAPDDPEHVRQVLLAGQRLGAHGAEDAVALLEFWTGKQLGGEDGGWQQKLEAWQQWFHETYPDRAKATLPTDTDENPWSFDELLELLLSDAGRGGDAVKGSAVFAKATCDKCHGADGQEASVGPDLTSLTRRLTRKEILQSILHPSHVIADQYATKTLRLPDGRQIAGIVAPGSSGEITVLQADGERITVPETDVNTLTLSGTSIMRTGLIDPLTLEEITDLFAYLDNPPLRTVTKEREVGEASTRKQ
jgi:putative heme-binding domain-containing protein